MNFFVKDFNIKTASTDLLSFVGDAIYSLLVREKLIDEGNCRSNVLHQLSAKYVKASAQAKAYLVIEEDLTSLELSVYKRGRNAHNNHKPKKAESSDYHSATGLEALFGYLYLEGNKDRIALLFNKIWQNKD